MICLVPISFENIPDFEDTSYAAMSAEDKRRMVQESCDKRHNGAYFEILSVSDDGQVVGFMNLFAHSEHTISIGPEIKERFRGQGYGCRGEMLALQYAKQSGYLSAVANVREDNAASIALHEKLGFSLEDRCTGKHGCFVRIYRKTL